MPASPTDKYKDRPLTPQADVECVIHSAQRLGIEMDESEALQWLAAMAAAQSHDRDEVTIDHEAGIFGHSIAILDFSSTELARFRRLGELVGLPDVPSQIETALALSGSSAQSKVQRYPGDVDYFERVNIIAPMREEAGRILGQALRDKAVNTLQGEDYQLIEVHFGTYLRDVIKDGQPIKAGTPITWSRSEVEAGQFDALTPRGEPVTITWDAAALEPGWCKLDWVVADPPRGQVSKASNMLDATWEAPDGTITPLDGFLDPYFQEVYLEADSIPIFSKLVKHVSTDALDRYVEQLEHEIEKYLTRNLNYGKVAKRLYNVFRLTGHYSEAALIRELFDEPAALLYQVDALLDAIEEAGRPGSSIGTAMVLTQIDQLIRNVIDVLAEPIRSEITGALSRLHDDVAWQINEPDWDAVIHSSRQFVINIVNDFFRSKLIALPEATEYLQKIRPEGF